MYKGKELTFNYDEISVNSKCDLSLFGSGVVIANIKFKNRTLSLETNGIRDEFYLEVVTYMNDGEDEVLSDPIYEIPKTKEGAKEMILEWYDAGQIESIGI